MAFIKEKTDCRTAFSRPGSLNYNASLVAVDPNILIPRTEDNRRIALHVAAEDNRSGRPHNRDTRSIVTNDLLGLHVDLFALGGVYHRASLNQQLGQFVVDIAIFGA